VPPPVNIADQASWLLNVFPNATNDDILELGRRYTVRRVSTKLEARSKGQQWGVLLKDQRKADGSFDVKLAETTVSKLLKIDTRHLPREPCNRCIAGGSEETCIFFGFGISCGPCLQGNRSECSFKMELDSYLQQKDLFVPFTAAASTGTFL